MKTKLTRSPAVAARFILQGEVVAFPTETVYGLGANIFADVAIAKVFEAKGRPTNNPLIAHISDVAELELLTAEVSPLAHRLVDAFFPGPLTLVLPKGEMVSDRATAGLDTIGVRMPAHLLAHTFIKACGVPLVAPSANLSGRPSPTTWQAVETDLAGRISCILQGEQAEVGLESTVVDCTGAVPLVLRAGAVTLEQLQEVIPATRLAGNNPTDRPRSPGLLHRHYSPQAKVILIAHSAEARPAANAAYLGLEPPPQVEAFKLSQICRDVTEYAHELFHFFRACDGAQVAVIYCQAVEARGLGLALMDRLRRAGQT